MTFAGCIPWNKGKHWPEAIKKKISKSLVGRPKPSNSHPPSEATRKKLSEAGKGRIPWNKGKHTGQIPWNKGKIGCYSEESLVKMSQSQKGHIPWNKRRARKKQNK
jgi:hypothetical protein